MSTRDSWMRGAACVGADGEIFFPASSAPEAAEEAKGYCSWCPVRTACLEWALANPRLSECGVWGGQSEDERHGERRRTQRRELAARRRAEAVA
jgi:WhiB family redox-sensing transcriptional regulator